MTYEAGGPEVVQRELFTLERIRALVREWPKDAVPVIPVSELVRILEGG